MRLRLLLLPLLLLCAPSAWAQRDSDPDFRGPSVRAAHTIFSPLDLPAANSMRTGAGAPGPDYWQQEADYIIDARIDQMNGRIVIKSTKLRQLKTEEWQRILGKVQTWKEKFQRMQMVLAASNVQ